MRALVHSILWNCHCSLYARCVSDRAGREPVPGEEGAGSAAAADRRAGDCLRRQVQGARGPGHPGAALSFLL